MILVAGLGNYPKEYQGTRHNMGFMVLDKVADTLSFDFDREGFKSDYHLLKDERLNDDVLFLKPRTLMNLSGEAVLEASQFYKIPKENIIVIYDEFALPPSKIRLRKSGSDAGHKGIGNIIKLLGSQEIKRIKVGIGEPPFDPVSYVLGKPSNEELPLIEEGLEKAKKALIASLTKGFDYAMNHFN